MADSESILQLGIEAARAGDKTEARDLFRLVTREDPNNAQGWLWLAGVAEDREEKRAALERVLQIEPGNELARKGLAALTGRATGAIPVAAPAATPPPAADQASSSPPAATPPVPPAAAPTPPSAPVPAAPAVPPSPALPASTTAGRSATPEDSEVAAALASMGVHEAAAGGAKSYSVPPAAAAAGAAAVGSGLQDWTAPDFGDDAYDLSDYQSHPAGQVAAADPPADEQGGTVIVDDEPRRSALPAWVTPLVGVLAIVLIGGLLFRQCSSNNAPVATVPPRTTTAVSDTSSLPLVLDTTGPVSDTATLAASAGPATAAGAGAGATVAGSAAAGPTAGFDATLPAVASSDASTPASTLPAVAPGAASAPASTTTIAEQTAPAAQTTIIIEGSGTATAGQTTVAVAGSATAVAPPANQTQAAPPVAKATPVATPAPAPAAPPAAVDVAAAKPQGVPPNQRITANSWNYLWNYGFGPLKAVGNAAYGAARPTHGQWLAVTIAVANTSGQPTKIPDGFFVLKDQQNHVYEFNRAVSVEWFNHVGRGAAADLSADDQFSAQSTSTILVFDVPADASPLVLFSRENGSQGYMVR